MDGPVRVLSTLALKGAVSGLAGHYVAAGGARIEADFTPTLALLDRLRAGEADLAVQQISELKQVGGIEVIGPIPHQLQTPVFSAGRMAASPRAAQSDRLLRYLASPEVAPALRESGLEP
jgi:hypothetical protein